MADAPAERDIVFAILFVAGILFAGGQLRRDVVALLVVSTLMGTAVLTPREALAGFGHPVVLTVASLLIVGEMLTRTGVAHRVGAWIGRTGGTSEPRLLLLLMLAAALLGSAMSSTAVVAILIPVVLALSVRSRSSPSRLLMPLSFAALLSGTLTLIATPPNLIVSAELAERGFEPLGFFSILPVGLCVLAVALAYVVLVGRHLLPSGSAAARRGDVSTMEDLRRGFGVDERRARLRVLPDSPLAGVALTESGLGGLGVRVAGIERSGRGRTDYGPTPSPALEIRAGDVLASGISSDDFEDLLASQRLEELPIRERDLERWHAEFGGAAVMVHPESAAVGKSLQESEFRSRHGLHVLGVRRGREPLADFARTPLLPGDSLLVQGPWARIARLRDDQPDFVLLALPAELDEVAPARHRAPVALGILGAMVAASALGIVPVVNATLLAAVAAVLTRCLTMEDGYRAIHWRTIVVIAGMLPLADALQKTGAVDLVVDALDAALGEPGPGTVMVVLFAMTSALGLVLPQAATAVLMAPVAIQAAEVLSVSPRPLVVVVAIAASAAFVTPAAAPAMTLIVEPGSYRVRDFLKVGAPLLLLTGAVAIAVVPLVFPL